MQKCTDLKSPAGLEILKAPRQTALHISAADSEADPSSPPPLLHWLRSKGRSGSPCYDELLFKQRSLFFSFLHMCYVRDLHVRESVHRFCLQVHMYSTQLVTGHKLDLALDLRLCTVLVIPIPYTNINCNISHLAPTLCYAPGTWPLGAP